MGEAVMTFALVFSMLLVQGPRVTDTVRVRETAYARLETAHKIVTDPELVAAVEAKNGVAESQAEILQKDESWSRNPAYPLRKALTSNDCARRLRELVAEDPIIVEAFLMDSRGGIVCSTVETSDYWQGDEAKWKRTFEAGKELFLDEPAQDPSTGTFAVQLSALVSSSGRKQGAVTLTMKIRRDIALRD
jgi:hypothetical protein